MNDSEKTAKDPFLKTRIYTMLCSDNRLWSALNEIPKDGEEVTPNAFEKLKYNFSEIRKTYFEKYPELAKEPDCFNTAMVSAAIKLYFQKNETFIFL